MLKCEKCVHRFEEFCDIECDDREGCECFEQDETVSFKLSDGTVFTAVKWYSPSEKKIWWAAIAFTKNGGLAKQDFRYSESKPTKESVERTTEVNL